MRFVWLDTPGGGRTPVNPDQVAYVRQVNGQTRLVFGAGAAGLHDITVVGEVEAVVEALEEGAWRVDFASRDAVGGLGQAALDRIGAALEPPVRCVGESAPVLMDGRYVSLPVAPSTLAERAAKASKASPDPAPPPARPGRQSRRKKGARA